LTLSYRRRRPTEQEEEKQSRIDRLPESFQHCGRTPRDAGTPVDGWTDHSVAISTKPNGTRPPCYINWMPSLPNRSLLLGTVFYAIRGLRRGLWGHYRKARAKRRGRSL